MLVMTGKRKEEALSDKLKTPLVDENLSKYQEEVYDLDEGAEVITERISLLEEVQEEYEGQAQHGNILSEAGVLREQGGMQPEIQRHTEEATLRRAKETTGSQGKKKNGGNVEPGIGHPQYGVWMRDNEVTTAS